MVVGLAYTGVKLEKVDENEEQVQERGTGQGQKQTRDGGNVYISATKLVESPEYSASFLSRMYFTWLDEIIEKAGRVKLEYIDLFKFKGNDLPGACWERFKKTDASSTTNKSKKRSLLMRLAILLKWELILKVSVGLLLTVFKFSGPFFINQILNYLENKEGNEKQNGRAEIYGYCVGLLIFTTIQYIMENQSLWIGRKLSIKLKNALSCEIAEKSLNSLGSGGEEEAVKSNNAQQEGDTSGQENSTREALGLVSTDLTRVS
ncbi:putative ATP-binding cassette sub-family C member 13, partial [Zancudomyces culisetae]